MELSIPPLFAYIASWASVTGGVWALFERAEKVVRDDVRDAISGWLKNLDPPKALATWPATFAAVFDRVFGERHLSWRCFSRSCIASLVSVVILTVIWSAIRRADFTAYFNDYPHWLGIFGIFFGGGLLNLIPDYFSLLESRYVIYRMSGTTSIAAISVFLIVDFLVTGAIFLGGIWLLALIFGGTLAEYSLMELLEISLSFSYRHELDMAPLGIFFYSTFFTSVWVWLYALSGLALKLAQHLGVGLGFLKRVLDIDNKPLRSIGFVSMMLVTLIYLIVPFVR